MMKILITGGAGFIGTQLAQVLRKTGHEVVLLDKKPKPNECPYDYVQANICDAAAMLSHCVGIDVIYHLAAEHQDNVSPVSLYYDVNVSGTENVCAAAAYNNVPRIIFTSSVAVYGLNNLNVNEQAQPEPFNEYGKTKLAAEHVLEHWQNEHANTVLTVIRPTVVFGEENRGNVYNLFKQVVNGPFLMIGNGKNRKSIAYVKNVAGFLHYIFTQSTGHEIYNYVDQPDYTMNELVGLIRHSANCHSKQRNIPKWLGLLTGMVFDILSTLLRRKFPISLIRIKKFTANSIFSSEKAMETGYQPLVALKDGVHATITSDFGMGE